MKTLAHSAIALCALLVSCSNEPTVTQKSAPPVPYTIYHNGDILTMEGAEPTYVEALVVGNGKIEFVGKMADAQAKFSGANSVDLAGKSLLPGFIDAHGHLWMSGIQALAANLLPAPDGRGNDIAALIAITNEWKERNAAVIEKTGWIAGFGYDEAQLKENRHPTAAELDQVSTEVPVLFLHQSGHLAAVNTKGLEVSGITAATPDPAGGVIQRKKGSQEPNGVLEETAMFAAAASLLSKVDDKGNEALIIAGQNAYAKYGFTTAQEGRATSVVCETYKRMSDAGSLFMDVYAYPDIQMGLDYMKANGVQADYRNHFRVAGVKLSLDGSPSGKTAWLTKPYKVPPPGMPKDYRGYPAIPDPVDIQGFVAEAYKNKWQIITHCNGDASADEYIKAVSMAAAQYGNDDRRTVMIHAQTVREDQLDSMKNLGIIPSFFSMHTYYWGDWHRDETLGKERAYRISPTVSALQRNMIFTEHHDAPVAFPDALRVLHSTVNRVSRSGDVIGPDQRVSPYIALRSITAWAAYQAFEE
ncbi:MAG: amidohydrolase, partial [Flavobacteriales bacterium]|nr:amidohydrolase [Flavobacteriales bacterium]